MTISPSHAPAAPIGLFLVFVGSILAQASEVVGQVVPAPPSVPTNVGLAGLVASFSGLLLAGFQYYKVYMDAKQRDKDLADQGAKVLKLQQDLADLEAKRQAEKLAGEERRRNEQAKMKKDLADAADKRHKMRVDFNRILLKVQMDLDVANRELARYAGRHVITGHQHATAINVVADSVKEIAEHMSPPLDVPTPHVDDTDEPIPGPLPPCDPLQSEPCPPEPDLMDGSQDD